MRRRLFISGAVTAAVGLSGCSGDSSETDATPTDNAGTASTEGTDNAGTESTETALIAVLETHWDTYRDSNAEEHASTFHSDSPMRDEAPWESEDYWGAEDSTFTIESREVIELGETTATVNEIVRGEHGGNTSRWRSIVELRLDEGEWKVWEFREERIENEG